MSSEHAQETHHFHWRHAARVDPGVGHGRVVVDQHRPVSAATRPDDERRARTGRGDRAHLALRVFRQRRGGRPGHCRRPGVRPDTIRDRSSGARRHCAAAARHVETPSRRIVSPAGAASDPAPFGRRRVELLHARSHVFGRAGSRRLFVFALDAFDRPPGDHRRTSRLRNDSGTSVPRDL